LIIKACRLEGPAPTMSRMSKEAAGGGGKKREGKRDITDIDRSIGLGASGTCT